MTFAPISVVPTALTYDLLLTLATPASHHDPADQTDSNRQLFNRQKHLLPIAASPAMPDQASVDDLCEAHPVPGDIADVFGDLSFAEFSATALVRLFIDLYNSPDGEGLFGGLERYRFLETRLHAAAVVSPTLRSLWNRLCDGLQVGIHGSAHDAVLFGLLSQPPGMQQLVLRALADEYRSVVALARLWHTTAKLQDERYADRIGVPVGAGSRVLTFDATRIPAGSDRAAVVEVPAVSGNSLRHQVVREPAWQHLCANLGLAETEPGKGPVPPGVEALFYNGGNIQAGSKQPSNTHALAQRARALYPVLDLLGGVTDSFDLGESRLSVAGWLVCRENRTAFAGSSAYDLPAAEVSAFDLLDDVTLTRQAGRTGLGQMIYSFETLCAGAQVLCRLSLAPWTAYPTRGALVAAVDWYLANIPNVGGQSARGFGHVTGEWLGCPEGSAGAKAEYEGYLSANRMALVEGLMGGTLGTGARILT